MFRDTVTLLLAHAWYPNNETIVTKCPTAVINTSDELEHLVLQICLS